MKVTTNIEPELYDQASKVLNEMGLTVDDAYRDLLTRIAKDKSYPLPFIPNAETIAAIGESERGEVESFDTIEDLMRDLNDEKS